jgi:hypothetical protein
LIHKKTIINVIQPTMSAGSRIGTLRNVRLIPRKKASILVATAGIKSTE